MTVFALRMTKYCNAVSKKHGEVARDMWKAILPGEEWGKTCRSLRSQTGSIC